MEAGPDDLRRHYEDLETEELLHLYRRGGLTASALVVLKAVLDTREPGWEQRDERWLRSDFDSFLREAATLSLPDEFGNFVEPLFLPAGQAPAGMEIEAAESRIGAPLPRGYKQFLRVLGPGCWCRANAVSAPADVFAFDRSAGEMKGFVAIVENVQGVGDYLAFNPADPQLAGERPVYYCSHDPYGHAKVADSFEAWARECAAAARSERDFYRPFEEVVDARSRGPVARKRWWHFWR